MSWRHQHSLVPLRDADKFGSSLLFWKTKLGGKDCPANVPKLRKSEMPKRGVPKFYFKRKIKRQKVNNKEGNSECLMRGDLFFYKLLYSAFTENYAFINVKNKMRF